MVMADDRADDVATADADHAARLRNLKGLELFLVMRSGAPVVGIGVTVSCIYLWAALGLGTRMLLLGVPLMLAGSVAAFVGLRTRLREARRSRELTTQGYGPILAGWALVFLGLVLPLYLS